MKALIVDDSRVMRSILKKFLATEGFDTLLEAGDGAERMLPAAVAGYIAEHRLYRGGGGLR